MPSLEQYFGRLPETMTIAPWLGRLLIARIEVLNPPLSGRSYASLARNLMYDCGQGVDRMNGSAFEPSENAQKVAAYPNVYRNECVRSFQFAYGAGFAGQALKWFRDNPLPPVPMPTYQQIVGHGE